MYQFPKKLGFEEQSLFWGFSLLTILSLVSAAATEFYPLALLPLGVLVAGYTVINVKNAFFGLLVVIPLSVEFHITNTLATDLPAEPMIVGLTLVVLLFLFKRKQFFQTHFFGSSIFLLIVAHLCWALIATINSVQPLFSVKYLLAKGWYVLVFVVLAGAVVKRLKDLKTAFWCLYIPLLIQILIVQVRHSLIGFSFEDVNFAIMPLFRNHVNYASVITLFYPFVLLATTWYKKGWLKHLVWFGVLLFPIAIFLSYTRACILGLTVAFGAYILLRYRLLKLAVVSGMLLVVLGLGYYSNDNNYLSMAPDYKKTVYHDEFSAHVEATVQMQDASSMERVYRWIASIYMIAEKPWFGYGPSNFYPYYKQHTVTSFETYLSENLEQSTVHNYFLLILVEQGIPGLIIFVLFTLVIFFTIQNVYNKGTPNTKLIVVCLLGSIVVIYVNLLLNDLIESLKTGTLFFFNLALLINAQLGSFDTLSTNETDKLIH